MSECYSRCRFLFATASLCYQHDQPVHKDENGVFHRCPKCLNADKEEKPVAAFPLIIKTKGDNCFDTCELKVESYCRYFNQLLEISADKITRRCNDCIDKFK